MVKRPDLEQRYFELGNELPKIYPDLNFKNHCYWRIVLDKVTGDKWNRKLDSPAYKNLSSDQLIDVVDLLENYKIDAQLLQQHNKESLKYRGKL